VIIQNWQIKKLSEICNLITDGVHNSPKYIDSGIPMLDAKHIKDNFSIDDDNPTKFISQETDNLLSKRCKPLANDLLISSRGTIGKIAIVKEGQNFNIMGNIILLRVPNNVISKYVAFSLQSKLDEIQSISRGVAQKGLYLNQVRNFEILIPSLSEQKRIVAILDEAFEGIDRAISNTEKNLSNARELFESYLNSIFSQKGEGWEVKSLDEICHVVGGGTPSKSNDKFYTGEIPWATVRDMKSEIISETECRITEEAIKKSSTNIIKQGNVVIATRVGLGKVCMVAQDTAINQDLKGIIPKNNNEILIRFLFWWLKSIASLIKEEGTGATVQGVKVTFINSLKIPLPPLFEQKNIVNKLDEISTKTQRIENIYRQKIAALKELKQSILQKAFNGELTADNPKIEEWEVAA
jgi:type I restriction enzyme S subunit